VAGDRLDKHTARQARSAVAACPRRALFVQEMAPHKPVG